MRVLAGLLFTACLLAATPAYASDRVVVRFSSSADASDRAAARSAADATHPAPLPGLAGVQVVTVPEGQATDAARTLDRADGVVWAQPDRRVHASAVALPAGGTSFASYQWGLLNNGQTILDRDGTAGVDGDFTNAWDTTEGAGVTIGIVDTGVDFTIPDLAANEDATSQWDFVGGDADASPDAPPASDPTSEDTYHGTHVAGIAAAALGVNDSPGDIAGGAPQAKIMAVRALDNTGSGWYSDIAAAFSYAAQHGAKVVNASLGGPGPSNAIQTAIHDNPGTLFVVAAGNDGRDNDTAGTSAEYPCVDPDPNVVCVAAVDNQGALASFSNYGRSTVDIAAPGVGILSYVRNGAYPEFWDGTSMATPYVSAAAALVFAEHPEATPEQVRASLIATARPLAGLCGRTATSGIVDAAAAVTLSTSEPAPRACGAVTLSAAAPVIGATLVASGTFDRGAITWSWQRCGAICTTIPGATGTVYRPQAADAGMRLRAVATATDSGGTTSAPSALTAAVPAAVPAPAPPPSTTPVATPVPPATPAPTVTPAPLRSPKLSVHTPRRRHGKIAVSGSVTRSFSGTVTIKVCAGRHCRTVRVRVRHARFAANVRPPRHGRLTVTVSVPAGRGFKAAHARRTIRA